MLGPDETEQEPVVAESDVASKREFITFVAMFDTRLYLLQYVCLAPVCPYR